MPEKFCANIRRFRLGGTGTAICISRQRRGGARLLIRRVLCWLAVVAIVGGRQHRALGEPGLELFDLAIGRPTVDLQQQQLIAEVGPVKAEKYGKAILALLTGDR